MPKPIDKSAIFDDLKTILQETVPELVVARDEPGRYDLYGDKEVQIGKQFKEGIYFASAMIQKSYVGFYFFPIYTHPDVFGDTPPELRKCLKGKSCFHIKKQDEQLFGQIREILLKGKRVYEEEGWI